VAKGGAEHLESLIHDSERILGELEGVSLEHLAARHVHDAPEPPPGAELVQDGTVDVEVTADLMTALVTLAPPGEEGRPVTLEQARQALESRGVRFGIDEAALREAVLRCATEHLVVELPAARGTAAREEVTAYLALEEPLLARRLPAPGEKVDFRGISPFVLVKSGQILARSFERQEGIAGTDVLGARVAFGKRSVAYPKPGKNTAWAGGTVVAACDGRLVASSDTFLVNEVLEVKGNVDYSTGHVDFPGDVVIGGEIRRGFKVSAGGSLFCGSLIDATEVRVGRDLATSRGILGRGDGLVVAGGGLTAKFVENCRVEAGGEIAVEAGILNSRMYTLDRVETGPRGVLIGGRTYAVNGVATQNVGSASGTRTEIFCGIDFVVQRKLEWIRDKNIALALRLKAVQAQMKPGNPTSARLAPLEEKLRDAIHRMNESARALVGGLDKNEAAALEVRGSIFPGCYIEICHVPFVVQKEMKRVRFTLNKEKGKVAADPL
jgi:uncharacterized protein